MRGEQLDALGRELHIREQATLVAGAAIMKREQLVEADIGRFAWQDEALCLQVDPEIFFPEKGGTSGKEAKALCAACGVRPQCKGHVLGFEYDAENELRAPTGIWAGETGRARHELKKRAD